jgi:hypothetical protein
MTSESKYLGPVRGNRKPRPEDVLHLAEQRAGITVTDAAIAEMVFSAEPASPSMLFTVEGATATILHNQTRLQGLLDRQPAVVELSLAAEKGLATITPAIVAREVANLIAAYPNAAPTSPEIFISTLVYDLLDLQFPDAIVVEACRKIRRTSKFVPSIAEVVREAQALLDYWRLVERLPKKMAGWRSQLEENIRCAEQRLEQLRLEGEAREHARAEARARREDSLRRADPKTARAQIRFPSLAEAFKGDAEILDLLGRADFEVQTKASGLLANKGNKAAREFLLRKLGGSE